MSPQATPPLPSPCLTRSYKHLLVYKAKKNKKIGATTTGTHQEIKFDSANLNLLSQAEVLLQLKMLKKAVLQLALSPSMQEPLPSAA